MPYAAKAKLINVLPQAYECYDSLTDTLQVYASGHLQLEQGRQEAEQVGRQEGPIDAPVALGRQRDKAHGLPGAQQRCVVQQLRAL